MTCHPERSEGSLHPSNQASLGTRQALVVGDRRFLASLGMTSADGVEYGDRTVSTSEVARRAVEKAGSGLTSC
jgi:hypothetical protein